MKRIVFPLVLAALALVSTPGHAGFQEGQVPYCTKNSDGSGYCNGTFWAFRNSSNAGDYAIVGSSGWFTASFNGTYYSCWGSLNSSVAASWPTLIAAHGYFQVNWDKTGTCSFLYATNASYDPSSW